MSLLATLSDQKQSAIQKITEIAERDAAGTTTAKDANDLARTLQQIGWGDNQYLALVDDLRQLSVSRKEADRIPACSQAIAGARRAIEEHLRETEKFIAKRTEELAQLYRDLENHTADLRKATRAQSEIDIFELRHPARPGAAPIDLDRFTLMMWPESIISVHDHAAPCRYIDHETFQDQDRRRRQIMQRARDLAVKEHQNRLHDWVNNQPKNFLGSIIAKSEPPVLSLPTWVEILEKGWNKTLDGEEGLAA